MRGEELVALKLAAAARLACIEKELDDGLLVGDADSPQQVSVAFPMVDDLNRLLSKEAARRSGEILVNLPGQVIGHVASHSFDAD
jgi:hypothetical protein